MTRGPALGRGPEGSPAGEATFVMPFDYLRIVFSLISGIIVIVGASLYSVRTDIRAKRAVRPGS